MKIAALVAVAVTAALSPVGFAQSTPPPAPPAPSAPPVPSAPVDASAPPAPESRAADLEVAAARRAFEELLHAERKAVDVGGVVRIDVPALALWSRARAAALADLERLSSRRIAGAVGDDVRSRYPDLFANGAGDPASADAALLSLLARVRSQAADSRTLEDTERHVVELKAQRQAIDEAIEHATRELVRQRAERLRAEADRRRAEEEAAAARRARPAGDGGSDDPRAAEIRRLREELDALRREVEALRGKAAPR